MWDVGSVIWDEKEKMIGIAHLTSHFAHLLFLRALRGKYSLLFILVLGSVKFLEPLRKSALGFPGLDAPPAQLRV